MTRQLKNAEIARQSNSWHFKNPLFLRSGFHRAELVDATLAERTVIGTISNVITKRGKIESRTEQYILLVQGGFFYWSALKND